MVLAQMLRSLYFSLNLSWKLPTFQNALTKCAPRMHPVWQACILGVNSMHCKCKLQLHLECTQVHFRCIWKGTHFACTCGVHLGCIWGAFRVHLACILGAFWVQFGCTLRVFWVHSGCILMCIQNAYGCIFGAFLVRFGCNVGALWEFFGCILMCIHIAYGCI